MTGVGPILVSCGSSDRTRSTTVTTTDHCRALPWAVLLWSFVAVQANSGVGETWAAANAARQTSGSSVTGAASTNRAGQAPKAVPEGPFTHEECLRCHVECDPALVAQWRDGPHGEHTQCPACHRDRHGGLATARQDAVCTGCHGGAVAHSYATSKHGVLVRIGSPDWTLPLHRGNHRSPGCAYCHLHDRDHRDTMDPVCGPAVREWVYSACHAPRYVAEQLAAGNRLTEIARVKVQEAEELAVRHPDGVTAIADHLESIGRHLANVRLGAGHQSPDYQWWHGQPALDGDLIRLRHKVAQALRQPAVPNPTPAQSGDTRREDARPGTVPRR